MKTFEKYLTDKSKDDMYVCVSGKRGCYWSGDKPIKDKGKTRCPVCGGPAGKNWEYKKK